MSVSSTVLHGNCVDKNPPVNGTGSPKIVLKGKFRGQPAKFSLDEDILSKHMMLVGGTGCGKSTLFYHLFDQIRSSLTSEDVLIVFDTKGDFYKRFYRPGDSLIGNSKQFRDESKHWNIFKEILSDGWGENDYIINTQEICKSLFDDRTKASSSNPFFPNAARDLLASLIVSMIRVGELDKSYRNDNFYNDSLKASLDAGTADDFIANLERFDDLRAVLSYIEGDGSQSQGVLSEMHSVIRDIFIGVFAEHGGFSMRNFVRSKGGKVLFIEYDLAIGSVLTPIYKILFDLAIKEALGRTASQGNVYLFCDEFKLLPNLQHIDDGVNFGRSLGLKVFAGLQSIEQLLETYGDKRGKNLAAGFSSIIAFKANDVSTRDYIRSLYGKNLILEQYQGLNKTLIEEKRDGNTVEDWDLNSLTVGEAIVGLPFNKPFRFYFDMYK